MPAIYPRLRSRSASGLPRILRRPWREAKVFEKSYLILLIQEMIEHDVPVHFVATHGDYAEIDTEEDYALANQDWPKRFPAPRKMSS